MGCLDSNSLTQKENNNSNYIEYNQDKRNDYIDTDNFRVEDFPLFQPYFYDKNIKNIKKVYEEYIKNNNNATVKIHKIFIIINYEQKNTISIEIEIEKSGDQVVYKHLKKLFYIGCYFDSIRTLIEKYNSIFYIDSSQWYESKQSTDIYIKAEKNNNNVVKAFRMFYEKDTSTLKIKKLMKYHGSNISSEEECSNVEPEGVVSKYNELKSTYNDNKPENFKRGGNSGGAANNGNYSNHERRYSNNNNNDSYASSNHNNNNESDHQELNRSGTMRDQCNREIGKIDKYGVIRDECNREIGRFDDDGVVRDECNREVGRFDNDGVFRDECNREQGRVDNDGVVRDECNRELGRIDNDGVVRDANNNEIGRADGISNSQAAYMYFFKE